MYGADRTRMKERKWEGILIGATKKRGQIIRKVGFHREPGAGHNHDLAFRGGTK